MTMEPTVSIFIAMASHILLLSMIKCQQNQIPLCISALLLAINYGRC